MSSELDFLKGIARALGPDVVGGPVDLAEMVVNLGRAGYGYAGHKMGLLKADQMPELLAASPGTSEWWAQKVNVPETGTGPYSAGRALPLLVGLARAGGVGTPNTQPIPLPQTQRGAIPLQNNASGESAASLEAISRVNQEAARDQVRLKVRPTGEVVPLFGPSAVDARAYPGEVILQKGVGAADWTVLDKGANSGAALVARAIEAARKHSLK